MSDFYADQRTDEKIRVPASQAPRSPFTKINKLYKRIKTKKFSSTTADSELCGAFNAMVVKNVKDANFQLKLLPISREYT